MSGSRIALEGNVTNNSAALETINLDLLLASTRTFNAASGGLALGGILRERAE